MADQRTVSQCARTGDVEGIIKALESGGSVNGSETDMSPLQLAARHNHGPAVQCLLDHQADVLHRDLDGSTAFDYATRFSATAALEVLRTLQPPNTILDSNEPPFTCLIHCLRVESSCTSNLPVELLKLIHQYITPALYWVCGHYGYHHHPKGAMIYKHLALNLDGTMKLIHLMYSAIESPVKTCDQGTYTLDMRNFNGYGVELVLKLHPREGKDEEREERVTVSFGMDGMGSMVMLDGYDLQRCSADDMDLSQVKDPWERREVVVEEEEHQRHGRRGWFRQVFGRSKT